MKEYEFEGYKYLYNKGKWLDSNHIIVPEEMARKMNRSFGFERVNIKDDSFYINICDLAIDIDTYYLYVLSLEDGKYYVGITKNVLRRIEEHRRGEGSEWTSLYKPIGILRFFNMDIKDKSVAEYREDAETIEMMKRYGVENVRGGHYCFVSQKIINDFLGEEKLYQINDAFTRNMLISENRLGSGEKKSHILKTNTNNGYLIRNHSDKATNKTNDNKGKVFVVNSKKNKIRK